MTNRMNRLSLISLIIVSVLTFATLDVLKVQIGPIYTYIIGGFVFIFLLISLYRK